MTRRRRPRELPIYLLSDQLTIRVSCPGEYSNRHPKDAAVEWVAMFCTPHGPQPRRAGEWKWTRFPTATNSTSSTRNPDDPWRESVPWTLVDQDGNPVGWDQELPAPADQLRRRFRIECRFCKAPRIYREDKLQRALDLVAGLGRDCVTLRELDAIVKSEAVRRPD